MGEARRHEELVAELGAELDRHMLAVGGRAAADVDGDVEDGAVQHADELGLGMGRPLEMQAAQGAGAPEKARLSCTKSCSSPAAAKVRALYHSVKKPRASPKRLGR